MRRNILRILQGNTAAGANLSARFGDPTQKLRMMFEPILEPVLVGGRIRSGRRQAVRDE